MKRHLLAAVALASVAGAAHAETKKAPEPLVFTVGKDGFKLDDRRPRSQGPAPLAAAVTAARGSSTPPSAQTTFGVA